MKQQVRVGARESAADGATASRVPAVPRSSLASRGGTDLAQRTLGNRIVGQRLTWPIQAKLVVGAAGDRFEQEADRHAKRVTGADAAGPLGFQRYAAAGEPAVDPGVEAAIERARGGGRRVPEAVRLPVELALGVDLRAVRVHEGRVADALTRSLTARAFTSGPDIFLRTGEGSCGTAGGQELLAHELVHVAQQGAAQAQVPASCHAPARVIQRVLNEEEERELKRLEAERAALLASLDGLKYKKLTDAEKVVRPQVAGLECRIGELTKKRDAEAKQALVDAEAAEAAARQAASAQRAQESAATIAANRERLAGPIAEVRVVAGRVVDVHKAAELEVSQVTNDPTLAGNPAVRGPLTTLGTAVDAAHKAAARAQAVNERTSQEDIAACLAAATAALADAEAAAKEVTAGIGQVARDSNLANRDSWTDAVKSIEKGYTKGVRLALNRKYASKEDREEGGFSTEYIFGGKSWCIHVHRTSAGVWTKAHVKALGNFTTGQSADLSLHDLTVTAALNALGVETTVVWADQGSPVAATSASSGPTARPKAAS